MKKLILILVLAVFALPAIAQDRPGGPHEHHGMHHPPHREHHGPPPFSYIGFSTGFNNPSGAIGFDFDVPLTRYLVLGAGGGFSTWGNKLHFDTKYFLNRYQRGWAIGGGITINSGDNHFKTKAEPTISGNKQVVYLDLRSQQNIFLAVYHYWNLGRRYNRFFAEAGWSSPLETWKVKQLSGDPITNEAKHRIDRMAPGGLMIGCGFSFGLHH